MCGLTHVPLVRNTNDFDLKLRNFTRMSSFYYTSKSLSDIWNCSLMIDDIFLQVELKFHNTFSSRIFILSSDWYDLDWVSLGSSSQKSRAQSTHWISEKHNFYSNIINLCWAHFPLVLTTSTIVSQSRSNFIFISFTCFSFFFSFHFWPTLTSFRTPTTTHCDRKNVLRHSLFCCNKILNSAWSTHSQFSDLPMMNKFQ